MVHWTYVVFAVGFVGGLALRIIERMAPFGRSTKGVESPWLWIAGLSFVSLLIRGGFDLFQIFYTIKIEPK